MDDPSTHGEKIGRNDPCPCGSGKKYRDCCYNLRCLERFAAFFGLIDIEYEGTDRLDRKFKLKTTALLDEVVTFHFQAVKAVN